MLPQLMLFPPSITIADKLAVRVEQEFDLSRLLSL